MISLFLRLFFSFSWAIPNSLPGSSTVISQNLPRGKFQRACEAGVIRSVQFNDDDTLELSEIFHKEALCLTPVFDFKTTSRIFWENENSKSVQESMSAKKIIAKDHSPFILEIQSVELKPFSEDTAESYNDAELCGYNQWGTDYAVITGQKCYFFSSTKPTQVPEEGTRKYGIYKLTMEKQIESIYFGQISLLKDGSSEAKRPEILDPKPFVKLQTPTKIDFADDLSVHSR